MDTTPTTADVTLTEAAAAAFHQITGQKDYDDPALKVGVAPGGCGGWEYQLGIAQRPADTDIVGESLCTWTPTPCRSTTAASSTSRTA